MASRVAASKLQVKDQRRLSQLVQAYFEFTWRTLRRLGVAEADLQDGVQSVFRVVALKLGNIAEGREQSFVFGTALRVAAHCRRANQRRRETPLEDAGTLWDRAPNPEEALQRSEAIEQLAKILDGMDESLRAVFVLFELEQLTMLEISQLLQLPPGTVASRLRRARELFQLAIVALPLEPEGAPCTIPVD